MRARASLVVPSVPVHGIGEDEEDDLVLSTALSGSARYLVTGDRHLQQIGSYQGLMILPPRDFLDVLVGEIT
jgi:predicted nucleic acid-binding protein